MIFDLTVRQDDWLLGLWWTEIQPGHIPELSRGAHMLVLARMLAPGDATRPPTWIVEECVRPTDEQWRRVQSFESKAATEVVARIERRQRLINKAPGCSGGSIGIYGGARQAAHVFAFHGLLPRWMSVMVIERKSQGAVARKDAP